MVSEVRKHYTGPASGRFFFHVMASLAEKEREVTIERTRAGLEIAREFVRKGGRKRQMTECLTSSDHLYQVTELLEKQGRSAARGVI